MSSDALDQSQILVSLVVATLGNVRLVRELLASLAAQRDAPHFEIILVDQSRDDALSLLISEFSNSIRIVHEQVPVRGTSLARNLGARAASGLWLGFPDDDCEFYPDTLQQFARRVSDTDIALVTGQTVESDPSGARWPQTAQAIDVWSMFGRFTEATLFVDRRLFLSSGGFDDRFGGGSPFPAAEGIDLMNRLLPQTAAGAAVYEPLVKLRHPTKIPPWNRWASERFHSYAIGAGAAIAKCPRPHMLWWGFRIVLSASRAISLVPVWRSISYLSRISGLWRGWTAFRSMDRS